MKLQDIVSRIAGIESRLTAVVTSAATNTAAILRYGIQSVTSGTRPSSPGTGQQIYETDTGQPRLWNGTIWKLLRNTKIQGVGTVFTGSVPDVDTGDFTFGFQGGTVVGTPNGSGLFAVTFPSAYGNGLVAVWVCMGDITVTDNIAMVTSETKSGFTIGNYHGGTGAAMTAGPVRWNWLALGW